ncbi:hypothetical protein QCA50_003681 [Cerrena zonata]|uniref:26S proteasome regulatory subunit Rpn6 N-terminal domain-containing protein n=1 Tax=Cerrena zonata TaxID=2478898 RepID=A0AAW0GWV1_9APHY
MATEKRPVKDILQEAETLSATEPRKAATLYQEILTYCTDDSVRQKEGDDILKFQETAIVKLGELYRDLSDAEGLSKALALSRTYMSYTAKAKAAKLIRTLLNFFNSIPDSHDIQITVLQDNIKWAKEEKRIFLKHSLETRLVALQLETQQYKSALTLIDTLLTELKRLDDKMILTEVHLLESRVYRGIGNLAKAKAALTSARTAA